MIKKKRVKNFLFSTILTVSSLLLTAPVQADTGNDTFSLFVNLKNAFETTWENLQQISDNVRATGAAINDSINLALNGADSLLDQTKENNIAAYSQLYSNSNEVQAPSSVTTHLMEQIPANSQVSNEANDDSDTLKDASTRLDSVTIDLPGVDTIYLDDATDDKAKKPKALYDAAWNFNSFFSFNYTTNKIGDFTYGDLANDFVSIASNASANVADGVKLKSIGTQVTAEKNSSDKTDALLSIIDSNKYKQWQIKKRQQLLFMSVATHTWTSLEKEREPISDASPIQWYNADGSSTEIKHPSSLQLQAASSVNRLQSPDFYSFVKNASLTAVAKEALLALVKINASMFTLHQDLELNNALQASSLSVLIQQANSLDTSSVRSVNEAL